MSAGAEVRALKEISLGIDDAIMINGIGDAQRHVYDSEAIIHISMKTDCLWMMPIYVDWSTTWFDHWFTVSTP